MRNPSPSRRRLVAVTALGLVAAPLAFVATSAPAQAADPVEINILATNDFHGRINDNRLEAGAAVLAGAVKEIRSQKPNTVFAAAGDLIGASTFESFIQDDNPTIDALNEAGLDVSAVGNHEFDKGYADLTDRVIPRAEWEYIGANVKVKATSSASELEPSYVQTFNAGDASEVKVGFVGAVTEDLPSLVSPDGIEDIDVTDIVEAVNTEADALKAQENLDLVVMLVHEGAPTDNCDTMDDDPTSAFGEIVTGVNANVDAIVSGHTHLAYNCPFPVTEWSGRAVTERRVVSAGQYGTNLNQLTFQVDPDTGLATNLDASTLPLVSKVPPVPPSEDETYEPNYPVDPATQAIVDAANEESEVLGAEPLGDIAAPFNRARLASGSENRGGESTLGNLVAEIQQTATEEPNLGAAQIAFMNPGGLRADLLGNNADGYPAVLTFKQAATVQPFANTLVNMDLTGAQIKTVLEQQWQPDGSSRPFLKLGASEGFDYTYDPDADRGSRIGTMYLDGTPIAAGETYSVTVNSFLSDGGDKFTEFRNGTDKQDTGQSDLQAVVDYLKEFAGDDDPPLPVRYDQRSVGVNFPADAPASYRVGDTIEFDLSSLSMSAPDDVTDTSVEVSLGGRSLGTFPVDSTIGTAILDEYGTASVSATIPPFSGTPTGLRVTGNSTGTDIKVPVAFAGNGKANSNLKAERKTKRVVVDKTRTRIKVTVRSEGERARGKVKAVVGGKTVRSRLDNGRATLTLKKFRNTGKKKVRVVYLGNAETKRDRDIVRFKVRRR